MRAVHRKSKKTRPPFYLKKGVQKGALVFLLLLIIGYLLIYSSAFECKHFLVEGNEVIQEAEIIDSAQNFLNRNASKSLVWPLSSLSAHLTNNFSYLEEIKIIRRWPNTLVFSLSEKVPIYCLLGEENELFLLDENAFLLEESNKCLPGLIEIVFVEQSMVLDDLITDNNTWRIIDETREMVSLFPNIFLLRFEIENLRIVATFGVLPGQARWLAYFNQMSGATEQIRRLELFLMVKQEDELERLDYVDIGSHEERVFYAEKEI
jgi:hypothetical protein